MRAGPITVTETATATGSFNGSSYTNALITLTFQGDTANTLLDTGLYSILGTGSVTVAGLGSGNFTHQTQAYAIPAQGRVGLIDYTSPGNASVLLEINNNGGFNGYALATSLGPLAGTVFFPVNPLPTSGGTFTINSIQGSTATYTATLGAVTATPEPTSIALLGLGGLAIAAFKLRRR